MHLGIRVGVEAQDTTNTLEFGAHSSKPYQEGVLPKAQKWVEKWPLLGLCVLEPLL